MFGIFGLHLSLGTVLISPCSLKQWLAQWMEDPNFYRLMFKGEKRVCLRSDNALFCKYAQVCIAQQANQSNCRKVPRQVCQVVEGCECCWQLRDTSRDGVDGLLLAIKPNHVMVGGCILPYATKWHAAICLAVQKALIEAVQLDFCRLISTQSRVEDLF